MSKIFDIAFGIAAIGSLCIGGSMVYGTIQDRLYQRDMKKWNEGYEKGLKIAEKDTWFRAEMLAMDSKYTSQDLVKIFKQKYEDLTY